jgi:signal transduction histidine kinase/CheY-like chemotaxis protein
MFPAFEFLQAGAVQEALDLLHQYPDVQVVILDLELDREKGTTLLTAMKGMMENYRVIVLTAHQALLAATEAETLGVFSYVVKTADSFQEALLFHINDAFTAIEKAWLVRKVDVHLEIVRKVNHLGLSANHDADGELKDVLDLICDRAVELLGAYTCHIRLLDPGRGDFVLWTSRGRLANATDIFYERVPLKKAYSGLAADTRERINVPDLQERQEFQEMKAEALGNPEIDPAYREYLNNVRSAYVVPISTGIDGNDIDAVFSINSNLEVFFSTPERQELVDDFVAQTNLAITKYRLKKKRGDIHDDYRNIGDMLEEISNVFIAGEDELGTIYKIVFHRISMGLGPEIISIFLFDEAMELLKNVAEYRGDTWVGSMDECYSLGVGIVGRVFSSGVTTLFATRVDEVTGQTDESSLPKGYAEENIRNIPSGRLLHYLAVPIKFGSDIIGVIRAVNKKSEQYDSEGEKTSSICLLKRGFSEDSRTELEIVANHLAATIKNAELIGELNKAVAQRESLYAVGHMISYGKDMNAVFELIVQSTAQVMHAEVCMLFLKNEKRDRVVLTHSFGMPLIEGAFYEIGEGKTGLVAETGELILEQQASASHKGKYYEETAAFLRGRHGSASKGIESFMAVPIIAEGRAVGVIKLINKVEPPFQFDEADLKLFQLFASQLGGLQRFLDAQRDYESEAGVGKLKTIGHDIKHNIGTALNYIDTLRYECDQNEHQEQYQIYSDMQDALLEAVGKLKNVLDGVHLTPRKEVVSVKDIFSQHLSASMRLRAALKSVDFVLEYSHQQQEVSLDVNQIEVALWNLFDNSLDALSKKQADGMLQERGRIEVTAYIKDHHLILMWKDNGCGIPKENHSVIFQASYTDKPYGNGLGLHILKNNIEGHGGKVSVESVEGEGATFSMVIPVSTD